MIPVDAALAHLLALAEPLGTETVPLIDAAGRVLAQDAVATRAQPPFRASAMDGYALRAAECETTAMFQVIGESAAGRGFDGVVGPGQAVRIFTGAPVPDGADTVVIQEDVTARGTVITITGTPGSGTNIRPAGNDFDSGQTLIRAPHVLNPQDLALLAALNIGAVTVRRQPTVALIATGDELVMPGETPGPDQIIASNSFGLHAHMRALGAKPRLLPIARDTEPSLRMAFDLAKGSDLILTIGGASVGDHDLVGKVAADLGMERSFYKVAMRPGKPLMAGRLGGAAMIGLPGNPVSAMVCGHVFVAPVIRKMLGLGTDPAPLLRARLAHDLGANGPRAHYMRAVIEDGTATVFGRQDSALLSVLAAANALVLRPPHAAALPAGSDVDYLPL